MDQENGTTAPRRAAHHLTAREWLLLLVLAAVQFTHIVDFMIIMPLGPTYMRVMGLRPDEFGNVVAAYMVSAGLAALFAARILDRFGRKTALLSLYSGFVTGTFMCAVAPNYLMLLVGRTVAGAFGGVAAAVVLAIVGDAFPDARRGTATGVVMSAFSVASIVGVPFGLRLEGWFSWHAPFLALGGLGVVVLCLGMVLLPPLRGHIGRHPARTDSAWTLFTDLNHLRAFSLTVSLVFMSFMLAPYLPTFLEFNVGLHHDEIQLMYLCGGIATLCTLTPIGRLADEYGKLLVFRICACLTLGLILVMTHLPPGTSLSWVLTTTTAFMVASSGRMVPGTALITASAAPRDRGGFMSLNAAVQNLAAGLATVLAGYVIVGGEGKPLEGYPMVGLLACAATVASLYLAGRLRPAPGGTIAPDAAEIERVPVEVGG
jgi:predicted MFS family arabinose efflux permease